MPDPKQIPFLLQLAEDTSAKVRKAVEEELKKFGEDIFTELQRLSFVPNHRQQLVLKKALAGTNKIWLRKAWSEWLGLPEGTEKLEKALALLSDYQNSRLHPVPLAELLDQLAEEYREKNGASDPIDVAQFLFIEKKLQGCKKDYYAPEHSDLRYCIEKKFGLPITLSCIYILVGARLNLSVKGCNLPGHFLTRIKSQGKVLLVDCYEQGQLIDPSSLEMPNEDYLKLAQDIIYQKASSHIIIRRVLSNLMIAFQHKKNWKERQLILGLYNRLDQKIREDSRERMDEVSILDSTPLFHPGQLVRHQKYHYRGVIVDYDLCCQADEKWYNSKQTQPPKEQPWYHVLLHDSDQVTYVAQSNLEEDTSSARVRHPLVARFFSDFKNGKYVRNSTPWPGKWPQSKE